jgi:hypothetical protein
MSTNSLFTYKQMSHYTKADRTRRIVVVPSVQKRAVRDRHFIETGDSDKLELLSLAIGTRIKYDIKPPLTTRALLMTLFQAKFIYALSLLVLAGDLTILSTICGEALC